MTHDRRDYFADIKKQNEKRRNKPLTARDRELLEALRAKYRELGRIPTVSEVPQAGAIKARFGLWRTALDAAGIAPTTKAPSNATPPDETKEGPAGAK